MRLRPGLASALAALLTLPMSASVRGVVGPDGCVGEDSAWYDTIGCVTELPNVDRIVVEKSQRRLSAFSEGQRVREFRIALGAAPVGDKQRQGDNRTPEGVYPITEHKEDSAYHLALRLGYPTHAQVAAAQARGVSAGGDIMIHGTPNGSDWRGRTPPGLDWTAGCIALSDGEIEWLYDATDDGALVDIRP